MKKTLLALVVLSTSTTAMANWTSPDGNLTIRGNFRINFDSFYNKNGVKDANIPTPDQQGLTNTQIADDSRLLLKVELKHSLDDGSFIAASVQPLLKADGSFVVDDAYMALGVDKSWMFQIGRYEAMNLFPLGKDVSHRYAAGGDGIGHGAYYYMVKEARGRSGKAGQARIVTNMNNWTAEISTVYGETEEILKGSEDYREGTVSSEANSFMVRPAINYLSSSGEVSISFGGEFETNSDSVTIKHGAEEYNLAGRYGIGATTTLTFGNLIWNSSIAYQDAKELWKAETFNSNIIYGAFGLGGTFAKNKHNDKSKTDTESYVLYTAYTLPLLSFDNADVTFALSHSKTDNAYGTLNNDEQTTAFRTRLNYFF